MKEIFPPLNLMAKQIMVYVQNGLFSHKKKWSTNIYNLMSIMLSKKRKKKILKPGTMKHTLHDSSYRKYPE